MSHWRFILLAVGLTALSWSCDRKAVTEKVDAVGVGPTTTQTAPVPARGQLTREQPFPIVVRRALGSLMREHGTDMENLLWTSIMLDYEGIAAMAKRMADRPQLARPNPSELDVLNAQMPKDFFVLQERLESEVRALAEAAVSKNDKAIGDSYGRVTDTCIACHSLYLRMPAPKGE